MEEREGGRVDGASCICLRPTPLTAACQHPCQQSLSPNAVHMDVDFAVDATWFEQYTVGTDSAFVQALRAQGYHVVKDMGTMIRVCIGHTFAGGLREDDPDTAAAAEAPYPDTYRYVDVYAMAPRLGKHIAGRRPRRLYKIALKSYDHADMFPLRNRTIAGMRMPFPARPDRVLTKLYGDWRRVRHTLHGDV